MRKKWFLSHNIMVNRLRCIVNTFKFFFMLKNLRHICTMNYDHIYPHISLNNMTPHNFMI